MEQKIHSKRKVNISVVLCLFCIRCVGSVSLIYKFSIYPGGVLSFVIRCKLNENKSNFLRNFYLMSEFKCLALSYSLRLFDDEDTTNLFQAHLNKFACLNYIANSLVPNILLILESSWWPQISLCMTCFQHLYI